VHDVLEVEDPPVSSADCPPLIREVASEGDGGFLKELAVYVVEATANCRFCTTF